MATARLLPIPTFALTALLLAACGNTAPAQPSGTSGAPRSTSTAAATVATAAATAGAATSAATQAPAQTSGAPSAGTGTTSRFCLNTNDEVSDALQVEVARAEGNENAGFGGGCLYYDGGGNLVYSIGVVPAVQGVDLIATGLQTPGAVAVEGIGEGAVLMSSVGPLVYKQGNWYVTTGGTADPNSADLSPYRAALETLAKAGVARVNF